jgi:CRISPR system Cascade subunit CasB
MTDTEIPKAAPSFSSVVSRLAQFLDHGGGALTTGDIAGLRRMDPTKTIDALGFFKLAATALVDQLPAGGPARDEAETRWAAVIVGLARLGALHQPGRALGEALVAAQFSEQRFVRLLSADKDRLIDELPALGRFLAAKGVPADFNQAAWLLFSAGRADEERSRRSLARSYYAALAKKSSHA